LRLARAILATLAGAERTAACRAARALILVAAGAACAALALETGRRGIAIVATTRALLATGSAATLAGGGRLLFLPRLAELVTDGLVTLDPCEIVRPAAREEAP